MPNYRRSYVDDAVYFFTVVTYHRRPLFHAAAARRHLREAIAAVRAETPWTMLAMVLLPDHVHMLWRLPENDMDYSRRLGKIKKAFTKAFLQAGGAAASVTHGESVKRYRGIWQPRFWEHTIRDARDHKMHLDYIHANPVKHGLVTRVQDWAWSSFHRYVKLGEYELDWAGHVELPSAVEYFYTE